jgi:hypothetical protein
MGLFNAKTENAVSRFLHFSITCSDVNAPPAKAGDFGLRLKAGSVSHSADSCPFSLGEKVGMRES